MSLMLMPTMWPIMVNRILHIKGGKTNKIQSILHYSITLYYTGAMYEFKLMCIAMSLHIYLAMLLYFSLTHLNTTLMVTKRVPACNI